MLTRMRSFSALLLMAFAATALAQGAVWRVDAKEWARPRSGETVLQMPDVSGAVHALLGDPSLRLVLRYPGGEDGELWAEELKSWLVALGVPSNRLESSPGAPRPDVLELLPETNPQESPP